MRRRVKQKFSARQAGIEMQFDDRDDVKIFEVWTLKNFFLIKITKGKCIFSFRQGYHLLSSNVDELSAFIGGGSSAVTSPLLVGAVTFFAGMLNVGILSG